MGGCVSVCLYSVRIKKLNDFWLNERILTKLLFFQIEAKFFFILPEHIYLNVIMAILSSKKADTKVPMLENIKLLKNVLWSFLVYL